MALGSGRPTPPAGAGGLCFEVGGWAGLGPQKLEFDSLEEIGAIRRSIANDLELIAPRMEALERLMGSELATHKAYQDSKQRRIMDAPVRLGSSRSICAKAEGALEPSPCKLTPSAPDLAARLERARQILVVGVPGRELAASLKNYAGSIVELVPGSGAARERPSANSLHWWLAMAGEAERAAVSIIILGRAATRGDCDALRRRLAPHTAIACEHGSAAGAWLMATWDGTYSSDNAVTLFCNPGMAFREPSRLSSPLPGQSWPRISVVTPSFNQAEFLEECLRSVIDQDYPNLEYIVLDPGSTDGSRDILKRYAAHFDRLILEPDAGQSDGLNKGFRFATGDILTWVNSDDALAPGSLRRAALAFLEYGVDLVAGTCDRIDASSNLLYRHFSALPNEAPQRFSLGGPIAWHANWEKGDYFFQPEVFFTRDIWLRSGAGLKQHQYWGMDWDLWLRCAAAGATIIRIPDVLGISREQPAQKTTSVETYLPTFRAILDEFDQTLIQAEKVAKEQVGAGASDALEEAFAS